MADQDVITKLSLVWESTISLCQSLTQEDWNRETDCPGWAVQDHVSHIVGLESSLLGKIAPKHTPKDFAHVKNEVGKKNEIEVDWRRMNSYQQVLDELQEVTDARLAFLRSCAPDYFDAPTDTPIGLRDMREYLFIRILDCWIHEQDIRRAVAKPGHLKGPIPYFCFERLAKAIPFVVGKKAGAPDGSSVIFDVDGDVGRIIPVHVDLKRAKEMANTPLCPTVRLEMCLETFCCLCCGRIDPKDALSFGVVKIYGDAVLGRTILSSMNFMI